MEITSSGFILFTLVGAYCFNATSSINARKWMFALMNLFFLSSFFSSPYEAIPILLFILSGYIFYIASLRNRNTGTITAISTVIIASFIYLKGYPITSHIPMPPRPFVVVGISYMLFRALHICYDSYYGVLKEKISPLMYFNYTCSIFSLLSGPIQKYQDFSKQVEESIIPPSERDLQYSASRISSGFIKILVVSFLLSTFQKKALQQTISLTDSGNAAFIIFFSLTASLFLLNMYFNFSGYMDIMIGLGKLFGFKIPENFNAPFEAQNVIQFWTKWHITLSEWFRIYMFIPLLKKMIARAESTKYRQYLYVIANFLTFLVIGAWHGTIYVGIFLSIGSSINKLYEIEFKKRFGSKRYKSLSKNYFIKLINRGLVFGYISFSTICLSMNLDVFTDIIKNLGFSGSLLSISFISVSASIIFLIAQISTSSFKSLFSFRGFSSASESHQYLWLGAKIIFISMLMVSRLTTVPAFIYQAF